MYATKETLEEAEESRKKMKGKMIATNYTKINQLYKTFIPKKAPSDEQRYFSKASTYNVTPTPKPPLREMLKSVRLWRNIKTLETQIKGLENLIKQKAAFPEHLRGCIDPNEKLRFVLHNEVGLAVQPIRELAEELKKEFTKEVKEMLNIFKSMESEVAKRKKEQKIRFCKKKLIDFWKHP
ncbi:hypothetical protein Tco_1376494 [Tanacetum coccineum]